jgi:hypothetical protein
VLSGSPATPKPGDRVTVDGKIYEVMAQPGQPCFVYSDQDETQYRIFTKRIAAA